MKRIFVALKIHPSEKFLTIYDELKSACRNDKIKWVEPYNIHMTLKFLGETEEDKIGSIRNVLSGISFRNQSFELKLKDVGIFGSSYKPRVIWFGIEENESLINLANDVLDQMHDLGFEKDRQNFVPHLTIGRIKFIDNKRTFQEVINKYRSIKIQEQKVDQFYLIESILRQQGPEYKILESFLLK